MSYGNLFNNIKTTVSEATTAGIAGVKSGLNKKTLGSIAGTSKLSDMKNEAFHQAKITQRMLKRGVSGKRLGIRGKMAARRMGGQALDYLSASDYADSSAMKRIGVSAARTYGTVAAGNLAIGAADFLNPFGFGSIDD